MSQVPHREPAPTPARPSTARAIARIWPYVKPYRWRLFGGMLAALGASVVALVIPYVLQALVDGPLASGDGSRIWPAGLGVLALGILEAFFIASRRKMVMRPSTRIEASMRNALYAKLQDLPVAFHDRWESGQLLSRSVSDLSLIRRWLAFGIVLLVVNVVTIVIGFGVLFTFGWQLGLIFLVASIPVWVNSVLFERKYSIVARRSQDQVGDLATSVEQSVHGIRVLKAFGRGRYKLDEFAEQAEQLRGTEIEKAKAIAAIWFWLLLVPDVAFALCLLAGIWLASQGELSVGQLFAFFATATVLRFPIESIGFFLSMTFDTRTAVDRFFEVMDSENTITDPASPKTITEPRGALSFNATHFRYQDSPPQFPDLVNGVELQLRPGETMALVGLTGSGKTTLLSLVPRLYDVTGGSVTIDGVDVRDLTRAELRRHVGVAFEDATLFSSSVRDNVLLGRPDLSGAEADRVMREALDIAQAAFVDDLPDGVDTRVGEEGLSLSGGQRQRLALARAIAARPSVLVLDDPLSALDVDTEARVEAGLRRVLAETTSLIVAHRPSTVTLADRVALMENGRVTAVGTHSELMATNEHYRFVISSLDDDDAEDREEAMA
ncbi:MULTISPECIES: ABC transporter ATP-binding protein [unclassified Curtobacterium]|uniref:ABC transporter ATP-binding protein n=1 Tax=unclassified Curtobacterium TaxID=257496 RepID=UPI0025B2E048|nr:MULTISPECIES: ABC transporter ATP-binding protein [unclassified Curtobacterium]MDN3477524.1 ABC transporter ATP-binding protein [Curtobacterium sp. APC 4022]MDY1005408.1 ABC transporter ATP-binding protein [Curtobacterium sp. CFBP9011]